MGLEDAKPRKKGTKFLQNGMADMKLPTWPKKPRLHGSLLLPLNQPERARAKAVEADFEKLRLEIEKREHPAKAARRAEKQRLRSMRKPKGQ